MVKRLGYLCEILGVGNEVFIDKLRRQISKGYSKLDPLSFEKGKYVSRWNLYVNVSKKELIEWKVH